MCMVMPGSSVHTLSEYPLGSTCSVSYAVCREQVCYTILLMCHPCTTYVCYNGAGVFAGVWLLL